MIKKLNIMKYKYIFIIGSLTFLSLIFYSCEKTSPEPKARSTASYYINGQDENLSKWARAVYLNDQKDTINIYIDARGDGPKVRSIALERLLLKEGTQELKGIFKFGERESQLPTPSLYTGQNDGTEIAIEDWFYLDTTTTENWVNIVNYDEETGFLNGTFQFTAQRDTTFSLSGDLPHVITVTNGYFEATLE